MIEKSCPSKAAKLVDGKMVIDENVCKTCGVCSESKCPFKAVKPHNEVVYQIYVGGTWGKNQEWVHRFQSSFRKKKLHRYLKRQ